MKRSLKSFYVQRWCECVVPLTFCKKQHVAASWICGSGEVRRRKQQKKKLWKWNCSVVVFTFAFIQFTWFDFTSAWNLGSQPAHASVAELRRPWRRFCWRPPNWREEISHHDQWWTTVSVEAVLEGCHSFRAVSGLLKHLNCLPLKTFIWVLFKSNDFSNMLSKRRCQWHWWVNRESM